MLLAEASDMQTPHCNPWHSTARSARERAVFNIMGMFRTNQSCLVHGMCMNDFHIQCVMVE